MSPFRCIRAASAAAALTLGAPALAPAAIPATFATPPPAKTITTATLALAAATAAPAKTVTTATLTLVASGRHAGVRDAKPTLTEGLKP